MNEQFEKFKPLNNFVEVAKNKGFGMGACLCAASVFLNSNNQQETAKELEELAKNSNSDDEFMFAMIEKYKDK